MILLVSWEYPSVPPHCCRICCWCCWERLTCQKRIVFSRNQCYFSSGVSLSSQYTNYLIYRKHTNICNIPIYHCHTNILSSQYTNIHCHSISTLTFQETPFAKPRGADGGGRWQGRGRQRVSGTQKFQGTTHQSSVTHRLTVDEPGTAKNYEHLES